MSIASTKNYANQLDRSIHTMFMNQYKEAPSEFDKIAIIEAAPPGGNIKEAEISGLGSMQTKNEGTRINYVTPTERSPVTRTYTTYGLGFQKTEEVDEDELFGKMKKMGAELGKSAAYKRETVFWDLFNNGFATHTAWDSQYIFDASGRVLLAQTGTSQNNRPGSDGSLSETTWAAAMEYFYGVKNANGRPAISVPKFLIIPKELIGTANVLMKTPNKPGSMDNDVSSVPFYPGSPTTIHVGRHLTSASAWFVLADNHDFRFVWKRRVKMEAGDDFDTGNRKYKVTMRFTCFVNDPMGCYGTTG